MNPTPAARPSLADRLAKASSAGAKLVAHTAECDGQRAAEEEDRERAIQPIEPHRRPATQPPHGSES
jgi:hypothetical protein